jgi:hypothetical protein
MPRSLVRGEGTAAFLIFFAAPTGARLISSNIRHGIARPLAPRRTDWFNGRSARPDYSRFSVRQQSRIWPAGFAGRGGGAKSLRPSSCERWHPSFFPAGGGLRGGDAEKAKRGRLRGSRPRRARVRAVVGLLRLAANRTTNRLLNLGECSAPIMPLARGQEGSYGQDGCRPPNRQRRLNCRRAHQRTITPLQNLLERSDVEVRTEPRR